MELQVETAHNVTVLTLAGRLDTHRVKMLKEQFDQLIADNPNLVVDLAAVQFIDSSVLAALVQAMKQCRQQQGDLRVCRLQKPVTVIFELTRLDKAFNLYETQEEAIASYADQSTGDPA